MLDDIQSYESNKGDGASAFPYMNRDQFVAWLKDHKIPFSTDLYGNVKLYPFNGMSYTVPLKEIYEVPVFLTNSIGED